MRYTVRLAEDARRDLARLIHFLAVKDDAAAERALEAILSSFAALEDFPFSFRKADEDRPLLREIIVSFCNSGYVVLFEIDPEGYVTILAIRHQLEDDYL